MDAVDEMRNLMKSLPQTDEDVVAALDDAAAANAIAAADDLSSGELLAFDFRAANNNSSTQPMAVDGQASVLPLPQRIKKAYHAIIEAVQVRLCRTPRDYEF
jgi:hypothetical protein